MSAAEEPWHECVFCRAELDLMDGESPWPIVDDSDDRECCRPCFESLVLPATQAVFGTAKTDRERRNRVDAVRALHEEIRRVERTLAEHADRSAAPAAWVLHLVRRQPGEAVH